MNTRRNTQHNPKKYRTVGFAAFTFTVVLLVFALYNQFFYVDGTWFHGFLANGMAVFNGLFWIGLLFVFKRFLNRILNYRKANFLINAYLVFALISTLMLGSIVYESVKLYTSLQGSADLNTLYAFSSSSISGVLLLLIATYAIMLICILLGLRLSMTSLIEKKLFQILGGAFIAYGIVSLLTSTGVIPTDLFQFLFKASLAAIMGLIFIRISALDVQELPNLANVEVEPSAAEPKQEVRPRQSVQKPDERKSKEKKPKKRIVVKFRSSEDDTEQEEPLPSFDLDQLEDKALILSYFKSLSEVELKRLESVVDRKYQRALTDEQKEQMVLHHIVETKMYDHNRFLPK